jgi:tRNA 2-selenouridine synthase
MALFANILGFNGGYLRGGHKAFRNEALSFLEGEKYPFKLCTLYGLTGSGKTKILQKWKAEGRAVVDLEALAHHRGSAFGQVGIDRYGVQKDFENNLFWELWHWADRGASTIFVEGESRRIGRCQLPLRFMQAMLDGEHILVECPLEIRVKNILEEYVLHAGSEERLLAEARSSLTALKKRLGLERITELSLLLEQKAFEEFTRRLLVEYYDKTYALSQAPESFYHRVIGISEELRG